MRTKKEKLRILELKNLGFSHSNIAHELSIPRGTIRDICKRYADVSQLAEEFDSKSECCGFDSHHQHWTEEQKKSYSYLLGMYLGDGYINQCARCERIRITCDKKYKAIIDEVKSSILSLMPNKVGIVNDKGCVHVSCYSRHWSCLFPQNGKGRKHNRRIKLIPEQKKIIRTHGWDLLRGFIHSDGCRDKNVVNGKEYPRYIFTNCSSDIIGIFVWVCCLLDIPHKVFDTGYIKKVNIARRVYVKLLDDNGCKKE